MEHIVKKKIGVLILQHGTNNQETITNVVSDLNTQVNKVELVLAEQFKNEEVNFHKSIAGENLAKLLDDIRLKNYDKIIITPTYVQTTTANQIKTVIDTMRQWWVIPEIIVDQQFQTNTNHIKEKQKVGVLIMQLGTPNSPSTKDVRVYLKEFLNDPRVIDIPYLIRTILVNGIIVPFRAPKSAKIYKELWTAGGGVSPLMTHTIKATELLQERFKGEDVTFHMAMRYQNPSMDKVLEEMRVLNYDKIILLPMFPQYASASGGSALDKALKLIGKWSTLPAIEMVQQFHDNSGYIDSIVARAKVFNFSEFDHIIFSYHGLPERHVNKVYDTGLCEDQPCDTELNEENKFCYKATCYATTRLVAAKLGLTTEQYTVSFQSRLDKKWLKPFSDKVVKEWGKKGAKNLLVFSPAFVADCLETLIEIGEEYQEEFEEAGGHKVQLVPSSNDHVRFIDGMEELVRERV